MWINIAKSQDELMVHGHLRDAELQRAINHVRRLPDSDIDTLLVFAEAENEIFAHTVLCSLTAPLVKQGNQDDEEHLAENEWVDPVEKNGVLYRQFVELMVERGIPLFRRPEDAPHDCETEWKVLQADFVVACFSSLCGGDREGWARLLRKAGLTDEILQSLKSTVKDAAAIQEAAGYIQELECHEGRMNQAGAVTPAIETAPRKVRPPRL